MRSHKYIHDPKILLKQGQAIVSGNAENKFVHRVTMVNLILAGFSPKVLATYCGDSERVLQTWVQKVDNEGWNSLIATKQKGRSSRLSEEQIAEIREAVKDDPNNYGYNVWDGPALSSYIENTYSITYGVRAAQNLLHKMGFAIIRPQMYPSLEHPDEEAREDFKKK